MVLKIELDENDFREVASTEERIQLFGRNRVLADHSKDRPVEEIITDLLPSALVERVRRIVPANFELSEILIQAEVSGKVLGSGISGTFSMKLTRKI